jgi:hypothetical protein
MTINTTSIIVESWIDPKKIPFLRAKHTLPFMEAHVEIISMIVQTMHHIGLDNFINFATTMRGGMLPTSLSLLHIIIKNIFIFLNTTY